MSKFHGRLLNPGNQKLPRHRGEGTNTQTPMPRIGPPLILSRSSVERPRRSSVCSLPVASFGMRLASERGQAAVDDESCRSRRRLRRLLEHRGAERRRRAVQLEVFLRDGAGDVDQDRGLVFVGLCLCLGYGTVFVLLIGGASSDCCCVVELCSYVALLVLGLLVCCFWRRSETTNT